MQRPDTSLPWDVDPAIRAGERLVGDDFDDGALARWFRQEEEAFFHDDSGNSAVDPWYAYMRYVNERLGFAAVERRMSRVGSLLSLGPGGGQELEAFAARHPECMLTLVESSVHFREQLRAKFPGAILVHPRPSGVLDVESESQDVVCAFSVLHHIPNVSAVLREFRRVLKAGGMLLVRESCSSMGDWRYPRAATPNERGIPRKLMLRMAASAGLVPLRRPVPALLQAVNRLLRSSRALESLPAPALYAADRAASLILSGNDHYWRDSWFKKLGPSAYFYAFQRCIPASPEHVCA